MTQQAFCKLCWVFFSFSFEIHGKMRHMHTVILTVLQNTAVFSFEKLFVSWRLMRTLVFTVCSYIPDSEIKVPESTIIAKCIVPLVLHKTSNQDEVYSHNFIELPGRGCFILSEGRFSLVRNLMKRLNMLGLAVYIRLLTINVFKSVV